MKTFGRKNVSSLCFIFLLSMLVLSLCACSTGTEIKNVPVNSLVLSKNNFYGYAGDSVTVIASVYPENATDKKITWEPEDDTVSVKVDENDSRKATISILSTKAGTCNVTVKTSNSEVYSIFSVIVLEKENPYNPTDPSNPGEKTKYNLTISTVVNGSVTADKTKFAEGEEITLTVTPDTGYLLSSLKYINDFYDEIEIQKDENGAYKFNAPASNISILCYFEEIKLYTVSIDTVDNGTVVADKTSCYPGDTVTLTVTPAEGFKLTYFDNNYSYVNIEKNADGKYQFKMPASNITVRANFASIYEKVNNVVFNETELTVAKGDTVNLGYKVSPENVNYDLSFVVASTYSIYTSIYTNQSIASVTAATDPYVTVSNSGVITANEIGSGQMIFAKITDKAYGGTKYFGPVEITVKDVATKFVVYPNEINVKAGDTCSIYADVYNDSYSSDVIVRGLKVTNTCPAITFNGFGYEINTASSIEGDFVTGEITIESTDFPTYKVQVCVYKDNVPSDIKFDKKIVVLKPNQTYTPTITIANVTEGTYTPKIEVEYDDVISLSGNTITAKKNGYGVIKASIGNIVTSSPLQVIVSDSEFIESDESYSISYSYDWGSTITSNNYTVSPSAYGGNDIITRALPIVTNVNGQKMVEVYVFAENISDKSITTDITLSSSINSWIGSGANFYIRDKKAVVSVTGKTAKYSIFDISNGGIFSIDGTNEVTDASWAYATSLPKIVWKNVTLEKGNNAVFTYKCTIEDLKTKDFNAVIY